MPITTADYVLTDRWGDGSGNQFYNIYYVRHVGGTQSALDCIGAFKLSVMPELEDILWVSMVQQQTECYSILDPTDFDTDAGTGVGTQIGSVMPSFVAVNYPILRANRDFRNSAKRYGRLMEGDIIGNSVDPSATVRYDALQTALFSTWNNGVGTFELMMPRRVLTAGSYVLTDLDRPAGIGPYKVSTQNSRKV